jgi:hypothetical protein
MSINFDGSLFHQVIYFSLWNDAVVGFVVNDTDQVILAFESLYHIVSNEAHASGY